MRTYVKEPCRPYLLLIAFLLLSVLVSLVSLFGPRTQAFARTHTAQHNMQATTNSFAGPVAFAPPGRTDGALAYDSRTGTTLLFGGGKYNDTWSWDGNIWRQLHPRTSPPPRSKAVMAYDPGIDRMLLFGGLDPAGSPLHDTWLWDGTNWTKHYPIQEPGVNSNLSLAYDAVHRYIVLFGSTAHDILQPGANQTWIWNGWRWLPRNTPAALPLQINSHLVYDAARQQMLLLASRNGVYEWWIWTGYTWQYIPTVDTPPFHFDPTVVYDPLTRDVVFFAGMTVDPPIGHMRTMWFWDGGHWTARNVPGTPLGIYVLAASDTLHRTIVTYDPQSSNGQTYISHTLTWNGQTWIEHLIPIDPPPPPLA